MIRQWSSVQLSKTYTLLLKSFSWPTTLARIWGSGALWNKACPGHRSPPAMGHSSENHKNRRGKPGLVSFLGLLPNPPFVVSPVNFRILSLRIYFEYLLWSSCYLHSPIEWRSHRSQWLENQSLGSITYSLWDLGQVTLTFCALVSPSVPWE